MDPQTSTLLDIVSKVAFVLTVGSMFGGVPVCKTIWKKGSPAGIPYAPFLAGLVCGCLWMRYGLLVNDQLCIQVNVAGILFGLIYSLFYFTMSRNKAKDGLQALLALATLTAIVLTTMSSMDPPYWSGFSAAVASVIAAASPLVAIKTVFEKKTTEVLPFSMIFFTFVGSLIWMLYGILTRNQFITNQNGINVALSMFQLSLFLIYPSTTVMKPAINGVESNNNKKHN